MNVNNTYFCFILIEYGNFNHGDPSVFRAQYKATRIGGKNLRKLISGHCVAATNTCDEDDEEFTSLYPGGIPEDESGCALLMEDCTRYKLNLKLS